MPALPSAQEAASRTSEESFATARQASSNHHVYLFSGSYEASQEHLRGSSKTVHRVLNEAGLQTSAVDITERLDEHLDGVYPPIHAPMVRSGHSPAARSIIRQPHSSFGSHTPTGELDAGSPAGPGETTKPGASAVATRAALQYSMSVHSLIVFAAIWGVLTREGLVSLGTYQGRSVFPILLAQAIGCFIMGFAIGQRERIEQMYPPLFPAITTGYCGSITTFSTWMFQVFEAFANTPGHDRGGLYNFIDGLEQSFTTLAVAVSAVALGVQTASFFDRILPPTPPKLSGEKPPSGSRTSSPATLADAIASSLGPLFWAGSVALCAFGPRRWRGPVTFSLVFSPPGALLRLHLARFNAAAPSRALGFPLGTFSANALATAMFAAFVLLQRAGSAAGAPNGCAALQGLRDGWCGCLSTVSTLAVELRNSDPAKAWRYLLISWLVGQITCVLLFAVYDWTVGLQPQCAFPE